MTELIVHDLTAQQLAHAQAHPPGSVLLVGPDGVGKGSLARQFVATVLDQPEERLANYPYLLTISPADSGTISIEAIRELQKFLQLKTVGERPLRRAVIIEHAQGLTTEAQNAFLKLLEEPPADTILLLTSNSLRTLLPTILSRVQVITVHPPTEEQLQPLLQASNKDESAKRQAFFLSGDLPGLLSALLHDDTEHPLLASVNQAKIMLQQTLFERLTLVDGLSKQKDTAQALLNALERIAQTGLKSASHKQEVARVKQWYKIRKEVYHAQGALARSANAKLTITNLFLHL